MKQPDRRSPRVLTAALRASQFPSALRWDWNRFSKTEISSTLLNLNLLECWVLSYHLPTQNPPPNPQQQH